METQTPEEFTPQVPPPQPAVSADVESPAEQRARRWFIVGASIAGALLIGLVALLVILSIGAYEAAADAGVSKGGAVVGLLRDAAIIFVAFETLVIGILLIVLMLQMQSLTVLLRDEIKPMLEAANDTMRTVRGTTQFVSHNVVSPVMKWSGYAAGVRRIFGEISGLRKHDDTS